MPLPQVYPPNLITRPDATGMLPPGMQGTAYAQDRAAYQDQVSLQDLIQQMGAQQRIAEQPSEVGKNVSTNEAAAKYAMPNAGYESETKRLGNVKTQSDINTAGLQRQRDSLKYAQKQLDRAIEIGAVTSGSGPAGFAQFQQRLAQSGVGGEIQDFFRGVTTPEDFQGRLNHLKQAREKTNLDWAKLVSNEKVAASNASSARETDTERYFKRRKAEYIRSGKPEHQADALANRDAADLRVKAAGLTQPSPEQVGKAEGARQLQTAAAQLRTIASFIKDPARKAQYIKDADALEAQAGGGPREAPGLQPVAPGAAPKPKHSMSDLRKMYPRKSDSEIRTAYKKKFGVEPTN